MYTDECGCFCFIIHFLLRLPFICKLQTFGKPVEDVFVSLSEKPVAAASLGQVSCICALFTALT